MQQIRRCSRVRLMHDDKSGYNSAALVFQGGLVFRDQQEKFGRLHLPIGRSVWLACRGLSGSLSLSSSLSFSLFLLSLPPNLSLSPTRHSTSEDFRHYASECELSVNRQEHSSPRSLCLLAKQDSRLISPPLPPPLSQANALDASAIASGDMSVADSECCFHLDEQRPLLNLPSFALCSEEGRRAKVCWRWNG